MPSRALVRSRRIITATIVAAAVPLHAQIGAGGERSPIDSLARCDSIVGASTVDSVDAALFLSVRRVDGGVLGPEQARAIADNVGVAFVLPQPFSLSVFSGPARLAALRPMTADRPTPRPPTITGVYRVTSTRAGTITDVAIIRSALSDAFDDAASTALHDISALHSFFVPPDGSDSMQIDVRFSTDSMPGYATRLAAAHFPRMPIVDAAPLASNRGPVFPAADSAPSGEVVLRFVVDRTGVPRVDAVEAVRATSTSFLRAALRALPDQRFTPASIRGCRVAQLIDYPFTFVRADSTPIRH